MIYLDTSYIVKAYINEPHSDLVLNELAGQSGLTTSGLARVEFISALMRQRRSGELTKSAAEKAIKALDSDAALGIWKWIDISASILATATTLLMDSRFYGKLRSLDAIHLASAKETCTVKLYTHDVRMFKAAKGLGLNPLDVIPA